MAKEYNGEWIEFLEGNRDPSINDVLLFGRQMAAKYGFEIYY